MKPPLQCIFTTAVFKLSARARDLVLGALKWHRLPMCTRFLFISRESSALLFHTFLLHLRFKTTFDREKCVHSCISGTKSVNTMPFSTSTRRQWTRKPSSLRGCPHLVLGNQCLGTGTTWCCVHTLSTRYVSVYIVTPFRPVRRHFQT